MICCFCFYLGQYLATQFGVLHLSCVADNHSFASFSRHCHIFKDGLHFGIYSYIFQTAYLSVDAPIANNIVDLISEMMADQTSILNNFLQNILTRNTSHSSTGDLSQTFLLIHVAQSVSCFQTINNPEKNGDSYVELNVVLADADLVVLKDLSLLVYLDD